MSLDEIMRRALGKGGLNQLERRVLVAEIERLRESLRVECESQWPYRDDVARTDMAQILRCYLEKWAGVGVVDCERFASLFLSIPFNAAPWLWAGITAGCGDELHCKAVDRLKAICATVKQAEAAKP